MIAPRRAPRRPNLQLHLDLAESPAPAAALWELFGEEQRQAAMALQMAARWPGWPPGFLPEGRRRLLGAGFS